MVVGPFIALIAAFGGPLATEREIIREIPTVAERIEPITETPEVRETPTAPDEPDFPGEFDFPSPEDAAQAIACQQAGGTWDGIACNFFRAAEPEPVEKIAELEPITEIEPGTTGAEGQTQTVVDPESPIFKDTVETTLSAGEIAVAGRTADLLGISLEESITRIEEQKAALPQPDVQTQFRFSVGDVLTWKNPHPVRGVQGSHFLVTATPETTLRFRFGGEPVYTGRFIDGPWAGKVGNIPESKLE